MMLVWVLVLTALLASDVAETTDSLGSEETQHHLEKRDIVNGPCAVNWFHYCTLSSCYRFFPQEVTWSDAEQQHFGHLATVTSSDHNTFITNVIGAVSKENPFAWIGLNDRCQEGNFKWIDGSSHGYRHWGAGQPDNHQDIEDCGHIHHDGSWNDLPCDAKHGFVCSYKLHCD